MADREAACRCGDFRLTLEGDPMLVSACCCTRCQRRTGSFFGVTAYFRPSQLTARAGASTTFQPTGGETIFDFCSRCGSSLLWASPEWEDVIGVAGGAFADPNLPGPHRLTHRATGHPFVQAPEGLPVYEDGPPEVD